MDDPSLTSPEKRESEAAHETDAEARRRFLKLCGKYAAAMPPAIALLMSASKVAGGWGYAG